MRRVRLCDFGTVPIEESMGCIYRIVCHATGRSYVGQTAYSHPFVRYRDHQREAKNGKEGPLYDDLRIYGVHAFSCECVCVVENEMLNALECYYAEQYGSYVWEGGYNVGECGGAPVRKAMSDARRLWVKGRAIGKRRWGL
jgi:hypothetical protein